MHYILKHPLSQNLTSWEVEKGNTGRQTQRRERGWVWEQSPCCILTRISPDLRSSEQASLSCASVRAQESGKGKSSLSLSSPTQPIPLSFLLISPRLRNRAGLSLYCLHHTRHKEVFCFRLRIMFLMAYSFTTSCTWTPNAIDTADIILTIASKIIKPVNISAWGTIGRVCERVGQGWLSISSLLKEVRISRGT